MKVIILNGPNLNLLGKREPEVYGSESFEQYFETLKSKYADISFTYKQSNVEGELVNFLQEADGQFDGIIMNPAAYSHTSVALSDAIAAISTKVVEVHISNIYAREYYRHTSLTAKNCIGVISGFGLFGYEMALSYLLRSAK